MWDLAVAKQHLGNKSLDATLVYAEREVKALTDVAIKMWEKRDGGKDQAEKTRSQNRKAESSVRNRPQSKILS
jgi:hypothetical protein